MKELDTIHLKMTKNKTHLNRVEKTLYAYATDSLKHLYDTYKSPSVSKCLGYRRCIDIMQEYTSKTNLDYKDHGIVSHNNQFFSFVAIWTNNTVTQILYITVHNIILYVCEKEGEKQNVYITDNKTLCL